MKWNEYESNYFRIAKIKNKSDEFCIKNLEYAKELFSKGVPIIYDQKHLCLLIGYEPAYVYSVSNQSSAFYRTFYIEKKNGKLRRIDEPLPSLKEIQTWILNEILSCVDISPFAKAFTKGKSIKDNARFHKNQKKILTIDIKDFFPSITFFEVLGVFRNIGYRECVAVMLAKLCCLNNSLPQGAPTSPILSNIIASKIDYKIATFIKDKRIRYTRYADDLTFSGNFNEGDLIKNVERILNRQGFKVNRQKIRVRYRNQRQEVTGIVVNDKMQVKRTLRRRIRSDIYYIQKFGLESHLRYVGIDKSNYLYHLIGLVSHALFINPNDNELKEYVLFLSKIIKENNNC